MEDQQDEDENKEIPREEQSSIAAQKEEESTLMKNIVKAFQCGQCEKLFLVKEYFLEHVRKHEESQTRLCELCGESFSKTRLFDQHMKAHNKQLAFRCETCGIEFDRKTKLDHHKTTHGETTEQWTLKCDFCDKIFPYKSWKEFHMKSHTGEKYECNFCKKSFAYKWCLTEHLRIHEGEKPYQCNRCHQTFASSLELVRHGQKHGEKPLFQCSFCEQSFTAITNLLKHERRHTSEKPHQCEQCKQWFSTRSDLLEHSETHNAEKRYECNLCGRSFTLPKKLRNHMRAHLGEMYNCNFCDKSYSERDLLKKHILSKHGDSQSPNNTEITRTLDTSQTSHIDQYESTRVRRDQLKQKEPKHVNENQMEHEDNTQLKLSKGEKASPSERKTTLAPSTMTKNKVCVAESETKRQNKITKKSIKYQSENEFTSESGTPQQSEEKIFTPLPRQVSAVGEKCQVVTLNGVDRTPLLKHQDDYSSNCTHTVSIGKSQQGKSCNISTTTLGSSRTAGRTCKKAFVFADNINGDTVGDKLPNDIREVEQQQRQQQQKGHHHQQQQQQRLLHQNSCDTFLHSNINVDQLTDLTAQSTKQNGDTTQNQGRKGTYKEKECESMDLESNVSEDSDILAPRQAIPRPNETLTHSDGAVAEFSEEALNATPSFEMETFLANKSIPYFDENDLDLLHDLALNGNLDENISAANVEFSSTWTQSSQQQCKSPLVHTGEIPHQVLTEKLQGILQTFNNEGKVQEEITVTNQGEIQQEKHLNAENSELQNQVNQKVEKENTSDGGHLPQDRLIRHQLLSEIIEISRTLLEHENVKIPSGQPKGGEEPRKESTGKSGATQKGMGATDNTQMMLRMLHRATECKQLLHSGEKPHQGETVAKYSSERPKSMGVVEVTPLSVKVNKGKESTTKREVAKSDDSDKTEQSTRQCSGKNTLNNNVRMILQMIRKAKELKECQNSLHRGKKLHQNETFMAHYGEKPQQREENPVPDITDTDEQMQHGPCISGALSQEKSLFKKRSSAKCKVKYKEAKEKCEKKRSIEKSEGCDNQQKMSKEQERNISISACYNAGALHTVMECQNEDSQWVDVEPTSIRSVAFKNRGNGDEDEHSEGFDVELTSTSSVQFENESNEDEDENNKPNTGNNGSVETKLMQKDKCTQKYGKGFDVELTSIGSVASKNQGKMREDASNRPNADNHSGEKPHKLLKDKCTQKYGEGFEEQLTSIGSVEVENQDKEDEGSEGFDVDLTSIGSVELEHQGREDEDEDSEGFDVDLTCIGSVEVENQGKDDEDSKGFDVDLTSISSLTFENQGDEDKNDSPNTGYHSGDKPHKLVQKDKCTQKYGNVVSVKLTIGNGPRESARHSQSLVVDNIPNKHGKKDVNIQTDDTYDVERQSTPIEDSISVTKNSHVSTQGDNENIVQGKKAENQKPFKIVTNTNETSETEQEHNDAIEEARIKDIALKIPTDYSAETKKATPEGKPFKIIISTVFVPIMTPALIMGPYVFFSTPPLQMHKFI